MLSDWKVFLLRIFPGRSQEGTVGDQKTDSRSFRVSVRHGESRGEFKDLCIWWLSVKNCDERSIRASPSLSISQSLYLPRLFALRQNRNEGEVDLTQEYLQNFRFFPYPARIWLLIQSLPQSCQGQGWDDWKTDRGDKWKAADSASWRLEQSRSCSVCNPKNLVSIACSDCSMVFFDLPNFCSITPCKTQQRNIIEFRHDILEIPPHCRLQLGAKTPSQRHKGCDQMCDRQSRLIFSNDSYSRLWKPFCFVHSDIVIKFIQSYKVLTLVLGA